MVEKTENHSGDAEADRRRRSMELPTELETRFVRVGDKLYRSPHDKTPVATITPDRIKARDSSALPDLVRLAKENGWTSLRVSGDRDFQRAAFLAASAQGLKIDGYEPDAKTRAAADRELMRQTGTAHAKEQPTRTANQVHDTKEQPDQGSDLAERFRRQSDVQNAKDPELRKAQSHVALAIVVAGERFPDNAPRQREFVTERKEAIVARLERGEVIAGIEVKQRLEHRVRELEQSQIFQKSRTR